MGSLIYALAGLNASLGKIAHDPSVENEKQLAEKIGLARGNLKRFGSANELRTLDNVDKALNKRATKTGVDPRTDPKVQALATEKQKLEGKLSQLNAEIKAIQGQSAKYYNEGTAVSKISHAAKELGVSDLAALKKSDRQDIAKLAGSAAVLEARKAAIEKVMQDVTSFVNMLANSMQLKV